MRLKHINIVATDADGLATFYTRVFGCTDRRPRRTLSGKKIARGMALADATIYSVWLTLPGEDTPFVEIHQNSDPVEKCDRRVDRLGYGHVAFEVRDIHATCDEILKAGGRNLGEVINLGNYQCPFMTVYMRDPEGNIIELEQAS